MTKGENAEASGGPGAELGAAVRLEVGKTLDEVAALGDGASVAGWLVRVGALAARPGSRLLVVTGGRAELRRWGLHERWRRAAGRAGSAAKRRAALARARRYLARFRAGGGRVSRFSEALIREYALGELDGAAAEVVATGVAEGRP